MAALGIAPLPFLRSRGPCSRACCGAGEPLRSISLSRGPDILQLCGILADNKLLRDQIEAMQRKYDEQFQQVFAVLEEMLVEARESRPLIGFLTEAQETPARPKVAGEPPPQAIIRQSG